MKQREALAAGAVGRRVISKNTAMSAYPNITGFVYENTFSADLDIAQSIFFGITSKGFSIIFNSSMVRSKPYITILIFSNSMYTIIIMVYTIVTMKKLSSAVVS